ncbi:hypothetical protein LWI29_038218 [Acer saccharum]|uniref:Uncharacterized protein n=1 Tax=Acer saccharum TaxID=4024 RepID=A0AA39T3C3_ACESA|nr:hypothetical protein LWI29_038218 [Acer saccharum]
MTITASPCIKDSCLMVRGNVVFTQVPQNVVVSPASSDSSAFIGATSTTQSSRHVFSLGFLENSNASPGSNLAREEFTLHDEVSSDAAAENTFYILLLPVLEGVKDNSGRVCKGLPKMSSNSALRVDWKYRKDRKKKRSFSFREENRQSRKEEGEGGVDYLRKELGAEEKGARRTFTETVRGTQRDGHGVGKEEKEKMKSMFWDYSLNDQLEVDTNPVDMGWLENVLALRKNQLKVGRISRPEREDFQIGDRKGVGEDLSSPSVQVGKARSALQKRCQERRSDMAARGKVIGQDKLDRRYRGVAMKKAAGKGKKMWCKRLKVRPKSTMVQNGKLVLDKRVGMAVTRGVRDSETSSTSAEDFGGKKFSESCREKGECSKSMDQNGEVEMIGLGLQPKPNKVAFSLAEKDPGFKACEGNKRVDLCVDLGQVMVVGVDGHGPGGLFLGGRGLESNVSAWEKEVGAESLVSFEELVSESLEVDNQMQRGGVEENGAPEEEDEAVSSDDQIVQNMLVRATIEAETVANTVVADSEEELTLSRRRDFVSVLQGSRFSKNNQTKVANCSGKTTEFVSSQ